MSHSNIRPTGFKGIFKPSIETDYTEQELDYIEERNFENLINNFRDILEQITLNGSSRGLTPRQRINLVKSGVIARSFGRSSYRVLPKARYLILKMDEENQP